MEEDVLNTSVLRSRFVYMPGGYDKNGNALVVINLIALNDYPANYLNIYVDYLKKSLCPPNDLLLSDEHPIKGFSIVCTSPNKIHKPKIRQILNLFSSIHLQESSSVNIPVTVYLVKCEGFWEKHIEQCTKSHQEDPIIMTSKSRLTKYFNAAELPEELGGSLMYNHDVWLNSRLIIDDYKKKFHQILKDFEELRENFTNLKQLRGHETEQDLKQFYQTYSHMQIRLECIIEIGNKLLQNVSQTLQTMKSQDVQVDCKRIQYIVLDLEQRSTSLKSIYLKFEAFILKLTDLRKIEESISQVTNWVIGTADPELTRKKVIGCDESSCDDLRKDQDTFELECRETYGLYGELNYKIEKLKEILKESEVLKDVVSQKQFMDFICRSFASRLDRRRNILISAQRFFRLVSEYYDKTSHVFESLIMIGNTNNLMETAAKSLQKLKDHEGNLSTVEKDIIKEGEKLSDILSIPFKDALGRDLSIDCSPDIANIREILEATIERRNIFIDSLELQKLTLEQITHINSYENDAKMAMKWMDDLYSVMIKYHSHVGCNIHEIQVQKNDLQTFEETGKSIFEYGKQLMEASKALRISCKLSTDDTLNMQMKFEKTWRSLQTISQENMTRLRVSAVFHRSVEEYCNKLHDLKTTVNIFSENREASTSDTSRLLRLRKYLALRECLLVEVGRMVRLGKLLKTRLKEPFTFTVTSVTSEKEAEAVKEEIHPSGNNSMACEAISHKLSEIAVVAEGLDGALQDIERRMEEPASHSPDSEENDGNNSSRETEDELSYATAASDATYVPQSRSSSFHTATHSLDLTSDLEEDHPETIVNSNNASYDSSDRSFYSAQQSIVSDLSPQPPTKASDDHDQENGRETETPTPIYNGGGQQQQEEDACEQQVPNDGISNIIADSNLDTERSSSAVEEILNKFSNRQLDVTSTIENWTTTVVEKKEIEMILEKIINENQETTRKTTTVDAQLYPVFSPTTEEPQTIQIEISEKLTSVLYELECAKRELEDRVETTLKIQTNNEESKQKINEVTTNLKSLQSKLEEIGSDYSNFLGHITNYVENVIKLRQHIDEFYSKSSSSANATTTTSMVDYENFRENCMDKFRLLIQQSEQLIERVRVLEPAGAKEHDTDRILKLLENLRIYFESRNSVKMAEIQEHEKINRFKSDYDDIVNSVNSVDKQLSEIEQQHIDSLASAKTTSIAYEYFERTVELLDNRIEHFKSTLQTYCNTAENEHTVKQKIQDLDQRWNDVKQRAKNKRISLTTITEYQTLVEKIEHEYKEIKYFLSSVSTKVPSLREPVEAGNLVNDVENYTSTRQKPLIEALNKVSTLHVDIPAKNKISTLQTEVTQLFQSFTKLKTEIRIVEEHLKTEERIREERIYKETLAKQKAEDDLKAQQLRVQEQQRLLEEQTIKETKLNEIFTEIKYSSPQFIRQLQDCSAKEGDRVIFECEVIGNPEPHIEWFKDGVSIQNNLDYKTFRSGKSCTLLIDEVFNADSATFICRASNLVGTCDTVAKLSIKEHVHQSQMTPPQILKYLENGRAREGSSYHFTVLASGNPLPTVQWFKNNICIDDSPDYVINYNNGEAVLYFEEVFLEDDAVYTCNFTNPIGFQQCSARLVVEPLEPTEIPYFRVPLTNVMSRVGQKIKLECVVGGIPRPDVYFTHNGKPYAGKNTKYENDRVTLIIPESYPKDAGTYTITAKNLAGEAYSTCHVSVKGRLPNETSDSEMASDIDPIKPSVQLPLKEVVSVFEGKPVRLDCIIVGQPEPEVIWYHNERPVKESDDVQLLFQGDRCSLLIHEAYLVDAGNYRVVAINSGGEASSICELSVTPLNIAEPATRNDKSSVAAVNNQPKFEKFLSDVLVQEGDSVTLDCVAKDVTEIKWFLTNNEISASDRIKISSDAEKGEHKITIDKVTADDKGVYTVKATNANGESKCFAQLIVKSVNVQSPSDVEQSEPKMVCPTFKELFTHKNVHLGESVKFECIVNGQPSPKIEWFFNDKLVEGDKFVISKDGDKEVLTIPDVIAESSGKIACVAENEIGKATCVAYLNLVGNGVVVPEPTSADVQSITQEHNTESSKVTIKKQVFTTTSTSEVNSYEGNIEQVAEKVTSEEKTSEIKNKEESSEQQTTLEVAQKSDSVTSIQTSTRKQKAPKFLAELVSKIVDSGVNVTMEACYEGFPSPEIKVLKNGEGLFDSEKLHITNKLNKVTIQIDDVNNADAGRYSVVATNPMGESTCTADVVVKKKIFPPVFGHRLQPQTVNIGDRVVLEVEVTGMPDPTIEWFKDGKPLEESRVSEHSIRNFGNTHTLVVEKAEISDAGKYMVRAVNDGGEAQSIANFVFVDQTQIESSSLQVEIQKETFKKEPPSFACERVDRSVGSDLHATSESKIVTEHRCTTEATMRLEHKTANLDLLPNHIQLPIPPMKYNGQTQTPPQVPPKPQKVDTQTFTQTNFEEIKTSFPEQPIPNNVIEHKESSFEKFKKMEIETLSKPRPAGPQSNGEPKYTKFVDLTPQQPILTDREMSALNITPGSPPEICFVPKPDYQKSHISDKKMEDVRTFSNGQPSPKFEENYSSTTSFVKEVKHLDNNITKGLPIYRPSAILTPAQATVDRAASPKPSADGVAMEKLWSSKHTDYESCYSEQESKYESFMSASETEPESEKPKSPFKHDLKAPFLVKQVSQKSPPKPILIPKSPIPDITLQPGSPPEICFAPKVEDRRHSLVETMERTLEENLATGPSKVLPHSVPTITPPSQKPFKEQKKFKPPPPVMPQKFTKNEAFESDYETDHWKYSGSEDETSFRPIPIQQNNYNKKFESFHKISKESTYEKFPNKKDQEFHEAKTESSYQTTNGHQQQPTPVSVPSPSKFAKTEFRESDYYSDFEEKRTSNADLQGFRSVKPPTPGRTSTTFDDSYRSVTPPSVFDRPSSTSFPTITPTPAPSARPQVFRPTPMPATKYIETTHESQPPTTTMYYRGVAGSPMHLSKMATETSNKMQIKESSETSQRYVNMEQTRKIIHFDNQEQNQRSSMPFSFSTPTPTKFVPCKTPPSQFAPCDIRESDYESEVDSAKIRPLWTPTRQLNDVRYRHVEPPRPLNRSTSVPRTFGSRILSPMEFDQGPKMPVPYVPAPQVPPPQMSAPKMMSPRMPSQSPKPAYQTQTLNRYSNKKITKHESFKSETRRDDFNLKMGPPPEYGYIEETAANQMKKLSSAFRQKSYELVDKIAEDAKRPAFKRAPSEGADPKKPYAYRDESRVSQFDENGSSTTSSTISCSSPIAQLQTDIICTSQKWETKVTSVRYITTKKFSIAPAITENVTGGSATSIPMPQAAMR
ncbi:hypothetical protein ACFFRR_010159 [Megaselia abdita]